MAYIFWQERQAKYLSNSLLTYCYFGFEYRQPMWDREIVDFWFKIPAYLRVDRKFLYETERHQGLVKELMQIPFANEQSKQIKNCFVSTLKKMIPAWLIVKFIRLTKRKVTLNEGLNLIYATNANSVKELLDPLENFPKKTLTYFQEFLHRFPYQMETDQITTLYTARTLLNKHHS
ncbi:MAG: hypothetical protein K8R74_13945 [Bacteroidales bacterium]|nr:hypothetical protein [Bacteroidales bacterium]